MSRLLLGYNIAICRVHSAVDVVWHAAAAWLAASVHFTPAALPILALQVP